jgi:large subunit ribosomal protein L6
MYNVEIPSGTSAEITGAEIVVTGPLGSNKRKFNDALVILTKEGNGIKVTPVAHKKLALKAGNAAKAMATQIKNDIKGVTTNFEAHMGIVFAHFPITVEVKGAEVHVKNIFGERVPRIARIMGTTKVEVKDKNVRVYGISLEDVTQTAANIRLSTKAHRKDERIFQDGIYHAIEE